MLYNVKIFDHPVSISSPYGKRVSPITHLQQFHKGTDFSVNHVKGYALKNGKVRFCGWDNGGGNWIWIVYDDGSGDRWFHLSKFKVKIGQRVKAGQQVCVTGATGKSVTGANLHYEYLLNGNDINSHTNPLNHIMKTPLPAEPKQGQVMVRAGWGLSHVAQSAGLPLTSETYALIYSLNKNFRGATDWMQLNAKIAPGDILNVSVPKDEPTQLITVLQAKYEALERLKAEIEQRYTAEVAALKTERENLIVAHETRVAEINQKLSEYENKKDYFASDIKAVISQALDESDLENISRANIGIRQQLLISLSNVFGSIENKFVRILAFVLTGGGISALVAILSGINWQALLQQNPNNMFVVGISFLVSTGVFNGILYQLEQLGQEIKQQADTI